MPSLLVSTISAADALTGTHSATRETTAPVRRSTSVAETRLVIFNPCCCRCASSATASSTRKPSSQASRSISRPLFWPRRWANVNVEHGRGAQHAGRKHTKCAHRKREERRVHDAIVPAAGVSARASVQSVRAAAATAAAAVRLSAVEARQLLFKFAPALTAAMQTQQHLRAGEGHGYMATYLRTPCCEIRHNHETVVVLRREKEC
eukprot:3289977-Pleurochrysis_carterae.AAC.2